MADALASDTTSAAAWFGCVDLKFGEDRCVRVLELGDGHTSGFTGMGAFIPQAFSDMQCARRPLGPFMEALIENKILTHNAFVDAGLQHLRPLAGIFPRLHTDSLAQDVLESVGGGPCVLKLADRQRGCGVVAVESQDLSAVLTELLAMPETFEEGSSSTAQPDRGQLTIDWTAAARSAANSSGLKEQVKHWQANECSNFIAEQLCRSKLVQGADGRGFDGTLRMGFALAAGTVKLLGSYWKLPDASVDSVKADLSTRIVSHTHGGSGTAACSSEDEASAWGSLQDALLQIWSLCDKHSSVCGLIGQYSHDPLFLALVLARVAAGQVVESADVADKTVFLAEQMLAEKSEQRTNSVRSYVTRTRGTLLARRTGAGSVDWKSAAPLYDEAVAAMPQNAAATYLAGMARLTAGAHVSAGKLFARSLAADCDFAPAYNQLATCCLLLGDSHACLQICEAMLLRHSRVAAAHHLIAMALYAQEADANERTQRTSEERRQRAIASLGRAKQLQRGKSWGETEEEMLAALEGGELLKKRPVRTWLFHAWRL